MAVTPDITFPTWTSMEKSLQLNGLNDYLAVQVHDLGTNSLPIFSNAGKAYSIVAVATIDSITVQDILSIESPSALGGDGNWKMKVQMSGGGAVTVSIRDGVNQTQVVNDNLSYTFTAGEPVHIVFTERGQGSNNARYALYINGTLYGEYIDAIGVPWIIATPTAPYFCMMEKFLKVGALSLYDYELSAAQVKEDYIRASGIGAANPADITAFTIKNMTEEELNGDFNVFNSAAMSDGTNGSYKVLNADQVSSYPIDPNTGLPKAGVGHWDAYCTFSDDGHTAWFEITDVSYAPTGVTGQGRITVTVNGTLTANVGDGIFISGLYHPTLPAYDWLYSGYLNVPLETKPTSSSFTFVRGVTDAAPIIRPKIPKFMLTYPSTFGASTYISSSTAQMSHTYVDVIEGDPYTVRVRGISTSGDTSPWLEASIHIGEDTGVPNPIYFTVLPTQTGIQFNLDFNRDDTGANDTSFHNETNIAYVELTAADEVTNRYDSAGDPGADIDPSRNTIQYSLPSDIRGLGELSIHLDTTNFVDQYCWARLVTTSGVKSQWYPNDSGQASLRDRFTVPPVLIGEGPVRPNNGSTNNMLPTSGSTTITINTTTASAEGPASNNGAGGIYQ